MMNRTPTPRATRPLNSGMESTSTPATPLTQMLHGENASLSNTNQVPASAPPHSRTRMNEVNRSSEVFAENSSMYHQRSAPPNVGRQNQSPHIGRHQQRRVSPERPTGDDSARGPGFDQERHVFDICRRPSSSGVKLNKPLFEINREKRKEAQDAPQHKYLRPGMVLLKKYVGHDDQVKIVQKCRELGRGVGGFYRPGYDDGAKLRLQMMCLGKNWDPESRKYEDMRPTDGATPPEIPEEFRKLVDGALKASHGVIRQKKRNAITDEEIPLMSPDICIVNYYGNDGRLGLHQDRDESEESLQKGLPVVSFSIGDSAEFLYGDGRDENTAKSVLLESGDVLIFGGKSRGIFHGVPCITPKTCPERLIEDINLKPGRLNLTFRKY